MGKGSGRRPAQVADDVVAENWRKAFEKAPEPIPAPNYCQKCGGTGLILEYEDNGQRVLPCDRC